MSKAKQIITIIVCLAVIAAGLLTLADPDVLTNYRKDSDFQYIEENGALILTKYNGSKENLIVPSQIDSKPVKAIKGAFCNNTAIKNIRISEGIETVDYMSFYGCTSLVRVKLPDSVKTIGHAAFFGCLSLENVILGSGLEEIMPYAFSDCLYLKSIELPVGLLFIGENAFAQCKRMKKLYIPETVEVIGGVTEEKGEGDADQRGSTEHTSFDGCDLLELTISPDNEWYCLTNGKITGKNEG